MFPSTKHPLMNRIRYFVVCLSISLAFHSICYSQQTNDTIPSAIKGKSVTGVRVLDTLPSGNRAAKARHHTGKDSTDSPYKTDSTVRKKHDPRKATLYSTFCPGLGQIYNHRYWKLPLVYAAVGIPTYTFFYNKSWYNKCQYALVLIVTGSTNADSLAKVDPKLKTFVTNADDNSLRSYRNEFRKDLDYSVLFFLLFWGLNIVDATVDAHLMNFDVTNELSIHLQEGGGNASPGYQGGYNPISIPAFSIAFELHKPKFKPIALP